jgi:hypothetical protein
MQARTRIRTGLLLTSAIVLGSAACKKSPTSPEENNDELDPRPVAEAMVSRGGMAACDLAAVVIWRGLRHAPAGGASLVVVDDQTPLQVESIGPSGADGVCTAYPKGVGGVMERVAFKTVSPNGTAVTGALLLRDRWLDGAGQSFTTAMVVTPVGSSAAGVPGSVLFGVVAPHLGCRPAMLVLRSGGEVVGQGRVGCETNGPHRGTYLLGLAQAQDELGFRRGYTSEMQFVAGFSGIEGGFKANLPGRPAVVVDAVELVATVGSMSTLGRSILTVTPPPATGVTITKEIDKATPLF